LPEGHDRSSRFEAFKFTRETDVLSTGVLYEVSSPSFNDRLDTIKKTARGEAPMVTVPEIVKTFLPSF
jgi:hypothetical protein